MVYTSQEIHPLGDSLSMKYVLMLLVLLLPLTPQAMCRDRDAWVASNTLAQSFFKTSEVFKPARVLKAHHPSQRKEVASYIKTGERYYVIFTLVDGSCQAVFRKRTRQWD